MEEGRAVLKKEKGASGGCPDAPCNLIWESFLRSNTSTQIESVGLELTQK